MSLDVRCGIAIRNLLYSVINNDLKQCNLSSFTQSGKN